MRGSWRTVRLLLVILLAAVSPGQGVSSKKGLQVQMVEDAIRLGVKHAALNVQLGSLVRRARKEEPQLVPGWAVRREGLHRLDERVRPLAGAGMEIYFILLARRSGDPELDALQIDPRCDARAPNDLGAFRVLDAEGRRFFVTVLDLLARRYRPGSEIGAVRHWIVGNEVNSHWWWYNLGRASLEEVIEAYEPAVRLAHEALRAHHPRGRVHVSLEHHWAVRYAAGDARQSCAGRALLTAFARKVRERGDFPWHVAFHPYPEDLFDCRFWEDESARATPDSPRVTFRNLEVLTGWLDREEMRHAGKARRVILSEQGFHCPEGAEGARLQAEAFARAWLEVLSAPTIDAFIYHRHVDHAHEGGLRFGLWTRAAGSVCTPDRRRPLWKLFRDCDGPTGKAALRAALAR